MLLDACWSVFLRFGRFRIFIFSVQIVSCGGILQIDRIFVVHNYLVFYSIQKQTFLLFLFYQISGRNLKKIAVTIV